MKQYELGLVVGKFYPPHLGHKLLIDTALAECDYVAVLVTDTKVLGWDIPPTKRLEWLTQIHATERVAFKVVPDLNVDDTTPESNFYWAEYTKALLNGVIPDAIYSSERYGEPWATALGAKHVLVDISRATVPVSGTAIRHNAGKQLDNLHPVVKAEFMPRVVVLGAESTGTTTLAKAIADSYSESYVPEYGRLLSEQYARQLGRALTDEEWNDLDKFRLIAHTQNAMEYNAAAESNRFVVCDTDSLATCAWWKRYGNRTWNAELYHIAHELTHGLAKRIYIITDLLPFEQDAYGTRAEGPHRKAMQRDLKNLLTANSQPYILATGSQEERLAQATAFINEQLGL